MFVCFCLTNKPETNAHRDVWEEQDKEAGLSGGPLPQTNTQAQQTQREEEGMFVSLLMCLFLYFSLFIY
jgi:hypothetical protein